MTLAHKTKSLEIAKKTLPTPPSHGGTQNVACGSGLQKGFTLLEIILALTIVIILASTGFLLFRNDIHSPTQSLARDIENLVSQGVHLSAVSHAAYQIDFSEETISLAPSGNRAEALLSIPIPEGITLTYSTTRYSVPQLETDGSEEENSATIQSSLPEISTQQLDTRNGKLSWIIAQEGILAPLIISIDNQLESYQLTLDPFTGLDTPVQQLDQTTSRSSRLR